MHTHCASSSSQDVNGLSALHMAAVEGHTHCATALVRHGAHLNLFDFSEERYVAGTSTIATIM